MALADPGVPVTTLRAAVAEAVARTSSHAVAREVGMSAPSLRDFINGSDPRPSTVRKLTEWYVRTAADRGDVLSEGTARAALALLVEPVPPERRGDALRELAEAMERGYRAAGAPVPKWLRKISET